MRVIVTGANGFIGRHCVDYLSESGHKVYALCHRTPRYKLSDVEYLEIELFDKMAVDRLLKETRATHLLHLAWYVNPIDYMTSTENIKWLDMSLSLLESFVKYGGVRIVTAGTCAEYDWSKTNTVNVINEDFYKNSGDGLYGSCKLALGNICLSYMIEKHLTAAHGRIFYVFGPGEHSNRLIPFAMDSFAKGKVVELRNGASVRDYLYVKDVASAFASILDSDYCGPINIASGEGRKLQELLKEVEDCCNGSGYIKEIQKENEEQLAIVANVEKLKNLGWKKEYPLKTALREYRDAFYGTNSIE